MKYNPIDKSLFETNRKNFMARMVPKSIAVFNSNDQYPVSADTLLPFEQHRDIFYLSGVDQEESILLLFLMMRSAFSQIVQKKKYCNN